MLPWSKVGGQLLSHQIAVVRGWWSAIVTSDCCGQELVASYCHIKLLWSGVGGQLLPHHVAVVRGWWSAIVTSCCCGQGLVVSYRHIMLLWSRVGGQLLSHHVAVVRGWWSAIDTFFRRALSQSFPEKPKNNSTGYPMFLCSAHWDRRS